MYGQNNYGAPFYSGAPFFGNGFSSPAFQQQPNQQPQQVVQCVNTNKVYTTGIEDVRSKYLPPNSDYIFLDNDKPILYQKVVDGKGQFEVKAFSITPYSPQETTKNDSSVDLSAYAKQSDLEAIKGELEAIKGKLSAKQGGNDNGTKA